MNDPVRAILNATLADAAERVDRARAAIVRMIAGGVPLRADRIKAELANLRNAIADRSAARELLRELHQVDGPT